MSVKWPLERGCVDDYRLGSNQRCPECGRYASTIERKCGECGVKTEYVSDTPEWMKEQ